MFADRSAFLEQGPVAQLDKSRMPMSVRGMFALPPIGRVEELRPDVGSLWEPLAKPLCQSRNVEHDLIQRLRSPDNIACAKGFRFSNSRSKL